MYQLKKALFSAAAVTLSVVVGLLAAEGVLRLKNRDMRNYDIEMWRYARELKTPSADPLLGHEHRKNARAVLQSVEIRTNEKGLRGGPVAPVLPGQRRLLFLGSSITLGWGVAESETLSQLVEKELRNRGEDAVVFNAGIGNYNSARYTRLFLERLQDLSPTDLVVHYFLRDAEVLERGGGNWLLRNSELFVTLWNAASRLTRTNGEGSLVDHYRKVYAPDSVGRNEMQRALAALAEYAKPKDIRLYLAMTPDVHNLANYPFTEIHQQVGELAQRLGYRYVDLLPSLAGLSPEQVWSMPGDPHPNALGHRKMAEAVVPVLHLGKVHSVASLPLGQ